ncbi:MAG TPA: hypothetical protein VLM37_01410 [Fibrobacteraceae bacterium]|nr:hypothetical protein [Fibrobacteraceae bacterium]
MPKIQINLEGWQDYRGAESGVLLYVESSHQTAIPVRDQLNENGKGHFYEPNYETSTWGLSSCCSAKAINAAIKAKNRYLLFGTRYEGFNTEFRNRFIIMGYQQIEKIRDLRSRHLQHFLASGCAEESECIALDRIMATWGPMRFVSLEDSFVLTDDQIKAWGLRGRASRQLKLTLTGEPLSQVLAHLSSKTDRIDDYIATVEELKAALDEDDESEAVNESA